MSNPRTLEYRAQAEDDGLAVGHILRHHLGIADHVIRHAKWIESGICLDAVPTHATALARTGQLLSIIVGDSGRSSGIAPGRQDLVSRLKIVFEDEDLLIVDKPAGIAMYPGPGHHDDTLANAIISHYDATAQDCTDFHPVHRLDKGTSGLVVVAKHAAAQDKLSHELHTQEFLRIYLCLCEGGFKQPDGYIDAPIARDTDELSRWMVSGDGKPARTHYQLIATSQETVRVDPLSEEKTNALTHENATDPHEVGLLQVRLETGRTHQIRVHLAHVGHPLLGDVAYGKPSTLIGRPALHSAHLGLTHPITRARLVFDSLPPEDFCAVCVSRGISRATLHPIFT